MARYITAVFLLACLKACASFQIPVKPLSAFSPLHMAPKEVEESVVEKVKEMFKESPEKTDYDDLITSIFPGALSNEELETRVVEVLEKKGFTSTNTLLATSLCCDELARRLEDDFVKVYGNNFNLGGLSGFPFAGNTGFGALLQSECNE